MNEKIKNYQEISKNGIIENTKSIIINKFGFMPKQEKKSSENVNNGIYLLSKTSINNSKIKKKSAQLKLSILGNNKKLINNDKKNSLSCKSLLSSVPHVPILKQKKISRNYNQTCSSITNDNTNTKTNTKYFSSFLNSKPKKFNSLHNNYNYSYSITNYDNAKRKSKKFISFDDKTRKIKSYINKSKNKSNEGVLNVKPIIKNENLINNQLWSKLITTIDQKQNDKINKLKKNYLNKVNININANININIKKQIVNITKDNNDITLDNKCNISDNNIQISNNNNMNIIKNISQNYLPDISLNDITNFIPPEKDISTVSLINEDSNNALLSKENKNNIKKMIKEHIKENKESKDSKESKGSKENKEKENKETNNNNHKDNINGKSENQEENEINNNNKVSVYEKSSEKEKDEKDKNIETSNMASIKKENNLRNLYSSSGFDDSHDEINDNENNNALFKREIKFCDSETFKTSNNKSEKMKNEDKKEIENNKVLNKPNFSDVSSPSFIGDNNSYHRVIRQTIDEVSSGNDQANRVNNESDFTESNNRNIFNFNNNNIYGNNNLNIIQNNSESRSENFKIYRLLSKNYSYNVSTRDIHDEVAKTFNHENPNVNYFFISEVEKKNKNIVNMNKKKFLKLKDEPIFRILSFGIDIYLPLINSDIHIKNKINKSLYNIYENIIHSFKFTYKDYLEVIQYRFEQNKVKSFYNNNSYILDLILNCKIISKNIEQSIEISCNYSSNNKNYDYLWKFDLQKKSKINKWITSEINTMKNYYKTISYTSQVSSFSYGDEIQLQINLFNINNILEPSSIEWFKPVVSFSDYIVYENTKFINNIAFDPLRACEVEKQVLLWHDKLDKEQIIIIEEIKDIFEKLFKIKNIYFDKSKFSFYKIVMVPKKVGFLSRNKYCSFDINIIDYNSPAKNEIQCIYYINTNNYTNQMDIRLGTTLTLYIVDMGVNK